MLAVTFSRLSYGLHLVTIDGYQGQQIVGILVIFNFQASGCKTIIRYLEIKLFPFLRIITVLH